MYAQTTLINNNKVRFIVNNGEVVFSVNMSCEWTDNPNKVAITRWLLKTWQTYLETERPTELKCSPNNEDKKGKYRQNIFLKLGFKEKGDLNKSKSKSKNKIKTLYWVP